jgi:hypothetical protein
LEPKSLARNNASQLFLRNVLLFKKSRILRVSFTLVKLCQFLRAECLIAVNYEEQKCGN